MVTDFVVPGHLHNVFDVYISRNMNCVVQVKWLRNVLSDRSQNYVVSFTQESFVALYRSIFWLVQCGFNLWNENKCEVDQDEANPYFQLVQYDTTLEPHVHLLFWYQYGSCVRTLDETASRHIMTVMEHEVLECFHGICIYFKDLKNTQLSAAWQHAFVTLISDDWCHLHQKV